MMVDKQALCTLAYAAQRGDIKAFEQLVRTLEPILRRYACRMLGDRQDEGMDIVQDAFVLLWEHLARISPEAISAWLYRIVTNRCIDHLRQRAYTPQWYPSAASTAVGEDRAEASAESADIARLLDEAMLRLSDFQRVVFSLFYLEDKTIKEIAAISQHSSIQVKATLYVARRKIKEMLRSIDL